MYTQEINIFISEKIFNSWDKKTTGFLSYKEFSEPIKTLKYGTFEEVAKIVFDIYDFNSDERVSTNDIKLMISYLPLKSKGDNRGYKYQLESLAEINDLMKNTFNEEKKSIYFENFMAILEKKANIFLLLVCYLYLSIPAFEKAMLIYKVKVKKKYSFDNNSKTENMLNSINSLINNNSLSQEFSNKINFDKKSYSPTKQLVMAPTLFSPVSDLFKRKIKNKTLTTKSVYINQIKRNTTKNNPSNNKITLPEEILSHMPHKTKTATVDIKQTLKILRNVNKIDMDNSNSKINNINNKNEENKKDGRNEDNNLDESTNKIIQDNDNEENQTDIQIIEVIDDKNNPETERDEKDLKSSLEQITKSFDLSNEYNGLTVPVQKDLLYTNGQFSKIKEMSNNFRSPKLSSMTKQCLGEAHINKVQRGTIDQEMNSFLKNSPLPPKVVKTVSCNNSPLLTKKENKETSKSPKKSCFTGSPQKNEEATHPLLLKEKINSIKTIEKSDKQLYKIEKLENLRKLEQIYKKDKHDEFQMSPSSAQIDKFIFRPSQDVNNIESEQEIIDPNLQTEVPDEDNLNILNTESINETIIEYLDTEEELKKSVIFEGELYLIKRKYINNIQGIELSKIYLVIIDKNVYYYPDKESSKESYKYTSTNYLVGSFIRLNSNEKFDGDTYNSFTIFFHDNKQKQFYNKDIEVIKQWVKYLRESINYRNLFDYYNILNTIGEGQYGKVTIGENKTTNEKVAIKIINKKKAKENPEAWDMIRTEIDILKISTHPNIIKYIDNYGNSDFIFIVMEYIKSGTFHDYLMKIKYKIGERDAAKIAFQLANAIKYLHMFGIIHRDLKPENIMILDNHTQDKKSDIKGSDIQVIITDFGFGKILGSSEKTREGYGTLGFVAPEILKREHYNNKVDIWSFGVIIFYMFAGEIPFKGKNKDETTKMIVSSDLTFPHKFRSFSNELLDF